MPCTNCGNIDNDFLTFKKLVVENGIEYAIYHCDICDNEFYSNPDPDFYNQRSYKNDF